MSHQLESLKRSSSPQHSKKFTLIIPIIIVAIIAAIVVLMIANQPEAHKRPQREAVEVVDVMPLELESYPVFIDSFGTIQAETSGNLIAQVSGIVSEVSPRFASGNDFSKGDVLLQVEASDYEIDVKIARSEVINAQLAIHEEQARSDQALLDWTKINPKKSASELVLRKPQVAAAKAKLDSAKARLEKAELSLKRTKVIAPYDGYIIEKKTDIGQLVNANSPVASIFSSDSLEVRLPVPSNKVQFLKLATEQSTPAMIKLSVNLGQTNKEFLAVLDRSHSVIDEQTRQWFVTAKLPKQLLKNEPWLKVGQFVSAEIEGVILHDTFVIPSKLITQDNRVFIYRDGALLRRSVDILWQKDEMSIVSGSASGGRKEVLNTDVTPQLQEGDLLVTTMLSFVADGSKAQLRGQESPQERKGKRGDNKKDESRKPKKDSSTEGEQS